MSLRSEYRLEVGEEPPLSVAAAAAGGEPAHSGRARRRSSAGGGPSIGTRASSLGPLAAPPTSRLAAGGDASSRRAAAVASSMVCVCVEYESVWCGPRGLAGGLVGMRQGRRRALRSLALSLSPASLLCCWTCKPWARRWAHTAHTPFTHRFSLSMPGLPARAGRAAVLLVVAALLLVSTGALRREVGGGWRTHWESRTRVRGVCRPSHAPADTPAGVRCGRRRVLPWGSRRVRAGVCARIQGRAVQPPTPWLSPPCARPPTWPLLAKTTSPFSTPFPVPHSHA